MEKSTSSNYTYASENETMAYEQRADDHEENQQTNRNYILLGVCGLAMVFAVLFHIVVMIPIVNSPDQDKWLLFIYKLIFYSLNGVYIYCGVSLIFFYLSSLYFKRNSSNFVSLFLKSKGMNIKISCLLLLLYFVIKTYEDILFLKNVAIETGEDADATIKFDFKTYLIENFSHIFLGISIVMLLALLKAIIIEGIDYMMYWSQYFQKVIQTNKDVQVLALINSITGKKMSLRSAEWVSHVFRILSPDGSPFNLSTLEYFFSKEDSEKIMKIFDEKGKGAVDEEHFVITWLNITKDKKEIKNVIEYKNILLRKLDYVVTVVFIPIMIFTFMSIIGKREHFTTYGSLVIGIILPLSFIFGSLAGDLFKSIIFVFFVRPFEVGDTIEIDEKTYKVDEIGLLFTSFSRQSLNVSISNSELMRKDIVNFRRSEIFEKQYTLEFEIDSFKSQVSQFKKYLTSLLAENKSLFKQTFKLQDIVVKNNDTLEISLYVYAYLHVHNLEEGIDEFSMELDKILKKSQMGANQSKSVVEPSQNDDEQENSRNSLKQ